MHVHPTPVHIRECATQSMAEEARKIEQETGLHVPLVRLIRAMNEGVTEACRQHRQESSNANAA